MNREQAKQEVHTFLDKKGYKGKRRILYVDKNRWNQFEIAMLHPEGLFIVKPDGSVEDNYNTFA